ncbi:MAG: FG-GAP repeat domain-containing protein, partial [Candidatus Competibacterales bacterium]
TFAPQTRFAVGSRPRSVTLGDVNGEGRLDIVTANGSTDDVSVLWGGGDGTFGPQTRFDVGSRPRSVTLGDVNGDGRLDIVTANQRSDDVSVLLNQGP